METSDEKMETSDEEIDVPVFPEDSIVSLSRSLFY